MKKFLILLCVCLLAACNNAQQEINNNKNNSENKEETSAITEEAPDICSLYPNSYKCKSNTSSTIAENNIVLLEQSSKQEEKQEIKTEEENTVSDEEEQLPEILKLIDEDNIDGLKKHIKQINEYVYTRTVYDDCIGGELELSITPLAYAVDKNKMEIVKFLLSKKADANKGVYNKVIGRDFAEQKSPLFIAVSNKNKEMAKLLISKGADVNFVYKDIGGDCDTANNSVLIEVIEWGDREILDLLLAKKVDLDYSVDLHDATTFALAVAVGDRNIDIIKLLLEHGANPNTKNLFGNSALDMAIYQEDASMEIIKLLLDAGTEINNKYDGEGYFTLPIMSAVGSPSSNSTEILKLLLDKGAEVNVKDMYGRTPLMLASENGDVEKVKLLLEAGANISEKNERGETALVIASHYRKLEVANVLAAAGAEDSLPIAAARGDLEAVKAFIEKGVDINMRATNLDGDTALTFASAFGHVGIVKFLLEKGADVNLADKNGKTALKYAQNATLANISVSQNYRYKDIIYLLKKAGAKE